MRPSLAHLLRFGGVALAALSAVVACKKVLGLDGVPALVEFNEASVPEIPDDVDAAVEELPGDASCGANRRSDPKNCGSCGHDCLGGACQAGRCQPVKVADTPDTNGAFAIWKGNLYFSERDALIRVTDGARTEIARGIGSTPNSVAADDTHVVWATYANGVRGCPATGCSGAPTQITPDAVVALNVVPFAQQRSAWPFLWIAGGAIQTYGPSGVVTVALVGSTESLCSQLTANDSRGFYSDYNQGKISTIVPGPSPKLSAAKSFVSPCAIHARGTKLYWGDGVKVWRGDVDANGTISAPAALAGDELLPAAIVADDEYVYWASGFNESTISRCSVGGCNATPETVVVGTPRIPQIAIDGPWLYFSMVLFTPGTHFYRVAL